MKKLTGLLAVVLAFAMMGSALAEAPDMSLSYCNPLNLPNVDVASNLSEMPESSDGVLDATSINERLALDTWTVADGRSLVRSTGGFTRFSENNYRTTADIFAYQISDGTVYLHVSNSMQNNDTYGACWSSTDYVNWEYHQMNLGVTAPTFVEIGDKYYLCGNGTPVYISDSPAGPWEELGKFVLPDGTETGFSDVCFFLDDDGRLYLSYSIGSPIMGCELNPENPCEVVTEPVVLWDCDTRNEWERFGSDNQNSLCGYTEGSQIFKYNGVYYLMVATNGTENITYCMGVKKSTEGPLSGYEYQQNNPVTFDVDNFIPAAGHGSFVVDDDGNIVVFYTSVISYENGFDRRVNMDVCYVDENGDIAVKEITDTPQMAPDKVDDPAAGSDLGLACLSTIGAANWASSHAEGHTPFYGTDNHGTTWWQPAADDEKPMLVTAFNGVYDVYAVQTNWKELGPDFTRDNAIQYTLEYFDLEKNDWAMLVDKSDNQTPYAVCYDVVPEGVRTIAVRLTILGSTEDIEVGVLDLRAFGENHTLAAEKGLWNNLP